MYWKEILDIYERMGVENIIPIAHTRITLATLSFFTYNKQINIQQTRRKPATQS